MHIKKITILILLLYIISFAATPVIKNYFQIDLTEPHDKSYVSDELSFLKTYYLMEKGYGYYEAFKISRERLAFGSNLQPDIFTWRMPTVFYVWNIFTQDGEQILTLFILLSAVTLVAVFLILKKFVNTLLSVFGSMLLLPYFFDTFRYKTAFLFIEWWGTLFFVIGFAAYLYRRNLLSVLFLELAVSTREIFIVPLGFLFMVTLLRRESWKSLLTVVVLSLGIYLLHSLNVKGLVEEVAGFNFFSRFHPWSIRDFQRMIAFSMRNYIFLGLKTHYLFLLLGILGLVKGIFSKKTTVLLVSSVTSLILFLPLVSVYDNDYWGIMFVPFIIFSIPILFSKTR